MEQETDYIRLLDAFLRGETSAREEETLLAWMKDPETPCEELARFYVERWQAAPTQMDDEVRARIRRRLDERMGPRQSPQPAHRQRGWRRIAGIAAAASLVIGILLSWNAYNVLNRDSHKQFEICTARGQRTSLTLSDGSRVWLNSDSRLSYDARYNRSAREVRLSGEGYFEVAKDAQRPFIVHTRDYTVEALGTSFNIRAYPDDRTSQTTLVTGRVRIAADGYAAELAPEQAVVFDRTSSSFRRETADHTFFAGNWRRNELVIARNTPLEELVVLLEREYNMTFVIRDESIRKLPFEGVIKNSRLDNVLDLITLSAPVKYSIQNNEIILEAK